MDQRGKIMIWVVAGTKDARLIIERLIEQGHENILVTTATEYGGKLLKDKDITIVDKRLDFEDMKKLISEQNIKLIIDASHPYAVNVSNNVIKSAKESNIRYIRFERKMLDYTGALKFQTLDELKKYIKENYSQKNILSTMGSNNLEEIKEISEQNNLYIRILPTLASIDKAEKIGFLPNKIIAIQGPVSKNMNKVILEDYNIEALITKESGETGGELEKIEACLEEKVQVLVLQRPKIEYPECFDNIENLLEKL